MLDARNQPVATFLREFDLCPLTLALGVTASPAFAGFFFVVLTEMT